jgi:putative ubiquitin-RnfH superfamily antitoxin RatB of RatAB toxin-antitoxin module
MEALEQGIDAGIINIEVVYATAQHQVVKRLVVAPQTTVEQAVELSGMRRLFPEIDSSTNKLGVFGKIVDPARMLRDFDRVEIYRPLIIDPKEGRRRRAEKCREIQKR